MASQDETTKKKVDRYRVQLIPRWGYERFDHSVIVTGGGRASEAAREPASEQAHGGHRLRTGGIVTHDTKCTASCALDGIQRSCALVRGHAGLHRDDDGRVTWGEHARPRKELPKPQGAPMKCRGHQCGKDATWRVTFGDATSAVYCQPCATSLAQMAEGTFHTAVHLEKLDPATRELPR